jgi:hypothetical protein
VKISQLVQKVKMGDKQTHREHIDIKLPTSYLFMKESRLKQGYIHFSKPLGATYKKVTRRKIHTDDPQILGATVKSLIVSAKVRNLVATATWHPEFIDPWAKETLSIHEARTCSTHFLLKPQTLLS